MAGAREICYLGNMITLALQQAQRDLPSLARKALDGEDVFIAVGTRTLRLVPSGSEKADDAAGPRPGRGALRDLLTIPDAFYEPWSDEEMGE
ncbi:hypothetical protein CCS01_30410 [Rhodopila globiformis]|uniref:Prevent-host-death protein n=1 Tax=Rhodopila globiformis TaxID=1071 RepID=A0A2S6MV92_RHOGL|nr:hypothetical protein CCS01_30410 [Rhodopila globiformis]